MIQSHALPACNCCGTGTVHEGRALGGSCVVVRPVAFDSLLHILSPVCCREQADARRWRERDAAAALPSGTVAQELGPSSSSWSLQPPQLQPCSRARDRWLRRRQLLHPAGQRCSTDTHRRAHAHAHHGARGGHGGGRRRSDSGGGWRPPAREPQPPEGDGGRARRDSAPWPVVLRVHHHRHWRCVHCPSCAVGVPLPRPPCPTPHHTRCAQAAALASGR